VPSGGSSPGTGPGVAGGENTGGGGGGAGLDYGAPLAPGFASGGKGIVIIRYAGSQGATGGTYSSSGGNSIHTFTGDGTFRSNAATFSIN
jgi:hypothetical protein